MEFTQDARKNNLGQESESVRDQARPINLVSTSNNIGRVSNFTSFEEILLEWSVNTVGRSWSVIADILRSYPLTSGQQFETQKLPEQYAHYKLRKGKYIYKNMRLEPTEDDKVPVLGRFKPYLLMNRMLPVYPQQYMLSGDYMEKAKDKEELKLCGKRRMREFNLPSEYEIRELKYKCTYDVNPLSLLDKNMHQTTVNKSTTPTAISAQSNTQCNILETESLIAKAPIYQLAVIISKQRTVNPVEIGKGQLRTLFRSNMETEDIGEVKAENVGSYTDAPFTSKVSMLNLLENLFSYYQDIFKYNWHSMTNAWYQNHRSIALYTRKPSVEHDRSHPSIKTENPSAAYGQPPNINYQKSKTTSRTLTLISNRTRLFTTKICICTETTIPTRLQCTNTSYLLWTTNTCPKRSWTEYTFTS